MSNQNRNALFLGGLVISMLLSFNNCFSQSAQTSGQLDPKLESFLKENKELRSVYSCSFTGRIVPIPDLTLQKLQRVFPQYRFHIAEMSCLIDLPPKKMKLITISDKEGGDVVAFVWQFSWSMPSQSFENILAGQSGSQETALEKVRSIAELLALTGNARIGKERRRKRFVEIQLLWEGGDDSVFRKVRLEVRNNDTFGKLTIRRQGNKPIISSGLD